MPNVLDNLAPPGMGNKLDSLPPPSRRDSAGDAVEGVMDGLKEAIKAIPSAVRHPLDSAYQMFEASKDQYQKAVKAAGPGRDNKGDVAGFIQHTVGMFPVLGPMASNLLDAADSGADSYEVGKRAGNLLSLKVVPEITKKGLALAGRAVDVAPSVGPALKAGAKAAAPDVAAGATKAAGGMALGELLPIPVVKHLVALEMSRPGLRQAGRGLVKGFNAARESFNPTTEAAPIAVSPQLDAFAVRAGFPDFASAPKEIQPLLQNAFEAEADRLAQTPPTVTPAPAGVTSSGPVRPPVATAAQMMREAETFRPPETFVPGGPLRPPVRTPAAAPAASVEPAAPAEMPASQQITEWLASREGQTASRFKGQTASRFTDPVVSEAPITKQTLGDIMGRLMRSRKASAEVPAATVPAEVPPAAVPEIVPPDAVATPQPATPAPSAAGKPVTAATLMEEATKPAGKKVPPFDWTDEAQYKEYQKALREDSNIYGNNRTSMADRVTRFMKKNGIEPTDSGIVKALEQSAEDIAVSPTTGLKRPSFNAADHEVLFDMIKDRMETPTAGAKPVASPPPTPAKAESPAASAAPNPPAAVPEVPKAAAKPKLDHGQLNLPLEKRGGGSIDSQLDKYKANQAKAEKAAAKEAAGIRKSDKAIARDLFTQHAQALAESTAAKRGIPVRDSIKLMDSMAKWEPKKLIKLLEKYQADNPKQTTVGELMEKAKK